MAKIIAATYASNALSEDISAKFYALTQRFEAYRAYRETVRELSRLSSKALADLGIHRAEIKRVAREAVYGA